MDFDINIPFETSFHQTHLWKCMFPYQREGVTKIVTTLNGRALIGDEMGLGKTLQAISTFRYYNHRTKKHKKKLLVICPAYLRFNWKNELEKWVNSDPMLLEASLQSTRQPIEPSVILTGKDPLDQSTPLIMSYKLAALHAKELKKMGFGMVICDESHYLNCRVWCRRAEVVDHWLYLASSYSQTLCPRVS